MGRGINGCPTEAAIECAYWWREPITTTGIKATATWLRCAFAFSSRPWHVRYTPNVVAGLRMKLYMGRDVDLTLRRFCRSRRGWRAC